MKTPQLKHLPALALGILGITATAQAQLITASPNLPPLGGVYSDSGVFQIYGSPALQFILSLPDYTPNTSGVARFPGGGGFVGTPADEIEAFGSDLDAVAEVIQNGFSLGIFPIHASGPSEALALGKIGHTTGTFDTEMLAMSLSGVSPLGPFMIRESPTRQSTGKTTIVDIGGGLYQIDSFFDVFTELSIDGGATWQPATNGAGHLALVPEPTSMGLLALGVFSMAGFVRRRR